MKKEAKNILDGPIISFQNSLFSTRTKGSYKSRLITLFSIGVLTWEIKAFYSKALISFMTIQPSDHISQKKGFQLYAKWLKLKISMTP